ncbi:tRNA pseudouridine(55) synthase TruB [Flocculibacter collagenilyticus]|uniref:tRNA pseudouridine(55) synthase TruB n=1 Tax=Flocculibacter collagenilyticus TaxID=2744479 RepID=UPI0018F4D830|nr:tRNA pseudouridine(55) synthase TruB [Flocculibacter collagenilyticus]
MARRRKGRAINGIILIDKPQGISSNNALQKVRWIFGAQKAGHTGALDPLATGMLPICLGEATKFSQFLLDTDKAYDVVAKFGERTTTSDSEGEVVETRDVTITKDDVLSKMESFRGPIKQVPSMFSALKYQGQPLYKYAREGIEVPREARDINIYDFRLNEFNGDTASFSVHCSKGTYIRSLIDDLGEALGCGAHVTVLRRTKVGHYPYEKMMTIEALEALRNKATDEEVDLGTYLDELLLPMDGAAFMLDQVVVPNEVLTPFRNGNPVTATLTASTELVRVNDESGLFLGVAELKHMTLSPKRLVNYAAE